MEQVIPDFSISCRNDTLYKILIELILKPELYRIHVETNYVSCLFCNLLRPEGCHINCLSCSKGVYSGCSVPLPGIDNYTGSNRYLVPSEKLPWVFRTPCKHFQRLSWGKYFRNISAGKEKLFKKVAAYETVEALYFGTCNGGVPCHLCAIADLDIYHDCLKKNIQKPCSAILAKLTDHYSRLNAD